MSLNFDVRGNLTGISPIQIDVDIFAKTFTFNEARKLLFENYVNYNTYLLGILGKIEFYQWVDGSFVTKKRNPKDIDIVNFVSFEIHENIVFHSEKLKNNNIKEKFGLDTRFVAIYPDNHPKYFSFKADSAYWYDWFRKTNPKQDRRRKKYPKSFVQINHK